MGTEVTHFENLLIINLLKYFSSASFKYPVSSLDVHDVQIPRSVRMRWSGVLFTISNRFGSPIGEASNIA